MCRTFAAGAEPPYRGVMGEKQRVRKHRVTIHVDESEKQKLDGWTMQAGLRREANLRKVLLENTVPVSVGQAAASRQLAAEMVRIGNNVNQIARVANQTQTGGAMSAEQEARDAS